MPDDSGTRYYILKVERQSGSPRVFKTRWFERFARKENIRDTVLLDAVARAEAGQVDADLGGGVIKQRIARRGQGKSGGYRTIIFSAGGNVRFSLTASQRAAGRTSTPMKKGSSGRRRVMCCV
jgi:hypothetical protein